MNLSGSNAIAAIASQAIVQTSQSNTVGRKTASLKASYEAINSNNGLSNFYQFNANRSDEERNGGDQSEPMDRLKRSRIRRNRTSNQFNSNLDLSNPGSSDGANADYNMNEPRYCYCDSISYGEMIFCENKDV
ncbi:hypothetical protein BLA29_011469, partial [Euroglyphus maynei]